MSMKPSITRRSLAIPIVIVCAVALMIPAQASAHARVSPAVSLSGKLQLYSLAVPTEKSNLTTSKIVMTVPAGFGIDSFVPPPPGWTQSIQQTGSGDSAVITKVTWAGGKTPTGEDSLFQFLAQPASSKTYTFEVEQTYSDGSIVDWAGPESSAAPAPTIEAKSSLGGGGVSALTIVALIVGLLGLGAGGFALVSGSGGKQRSLA
jgi:periplasmic copper chaperone A